MPWSRWQCRKSLVGSCLSPLTTEDTALIAPDESLLPRARNTSHATSHLVMGRLTPGYSMTIFMVRYYILIFYLITKTLLIFHAIQSQMALAIVSLEKILNSCKFCITRNVCVHNQSAEPVPRLLSGHSVG